MAAWSRKTLKFWEKILRFFKKRPLTVKCSRFSSESFHHVTDRRCCVEISCNLAGEKSAKLCVIYLTKKIKISPASQTVATARIASKICQGEHQAIYSEYSRFHPNRFTFGGVTAERVNTAKSRPKANPIFGESLAFSRIITHLFAPRYVVKILKTASPSCVFSHYMHQMW